MTEEDKEEDKKEYPGKRKVKFLSCLGTVAFGIAAWRNNWTAFAVGLVCWAMAFFITLLSAALFVATEYSKKIKEQADAEKREHAATDCND